MATLTVESADGIVFQVTVEEPGSASSHEVTVTDAVAARYAPGTSKARLVEASFEFLLEREPKESILAAFDLPVIERYFPEYVRQIGNRV